MSTTSRSSIGTSQVRPDNRLDDLPMTPVECQTCRAVVGVRKASWQQTSIQWDERASRICPERPHAHSPLGVTDFPSCAALRESISQAALSGDLTVVDV